MKRILNFATVLFILPPTALSFQSNSADYDSVSPALLGFSYPKLSPHLRKTLNLRNTDSRITALEVLKLAGNPWDTCTISLQKNWGLGAHPNHRRYQVICHGLPVFGAFVTSHGQGSNLDLVEGAIPQAGAEFMTLEGIQTEQEIREQMTPKSTISSGELKYFYLEDEHSLVPAYEFKVRDTRRMLHRKLYDAYNGQLLYQQNLSLQSHQGYSFLENSLEETTELVDINNIQSQQGLLDGAHFRVYGADEFAPRATAAGKVFDYLPEEELLFDQVQAYYTLERAHSFFSQFFSLKNDETLMVFTHSFPENNAMYVPGDSAMPGAIFLGTDDQVYMTNLNRDSDVLIHEYSHHIIYKFLTATWGESLTLHERTADFFAFVLSQDPYLAETLLPGKGFLRTAELNENRKYDSESMSRGSHQLGEFWSSLLWEFYQELGSDALTIIASSIHFWNERAQIADAILALTLADGNHFNGQNRCTILELAAKKGFYSAISNLNISNCNVNSADLIPTVIPLEAKDEDSKAFPSCGTIGMQNSQSLSFILGLPFLLLLWRRRDEA